jgi:hypothetical protein
MLKYYTLPSIKGEGWAHIMLNTETGFFATVSDWGSYSYIWTAPGGEFRAFLMKLQPDYLYGKLMMERSDRKVFDGKKTYDAVADAIEQQQEEAHELAGTDWAYYDDEKEHLESYATNGEFDSEGDFTSWSDGTELRGVIELARWCEAPDCTGFCNRIWPRFVQLLKDELVKKAV